MTTFQVLAIVVALVAAFGYVNHRFVHLPDANWLRAFQRWALHYRVEDILAAVVGFYFGSKS